MFLLKHLSKNKSYPFISLLLKLIIAIAAIGFIWQKIVLDKNSEAIKQSIKAVFFSSEYDSLFFPFLLMLLNWGIEALKWKLLIQKLEPTSFLNSFKAVFTGVTVSIFTPNRVGEFGGRIFFMEKENRIQGILLSFLGSTAQFLVTIVAGAIALLFYIQHYFMTEESVNRFLYFVLVLFIVVLILALLFFYLQASRLIHLLENKSFFKKIEKHITVLADCPSSELAIIFSLSVFRYIVFSIQFYLLLLLFNVNIPIMEGMTMIALTFFAITIIPTFALTELGIRGSAALVFIGILSENSIGIIAASFSLWIVNIAIPALLGTFFVFKLRFFEQRL